MERHYQFIYVLIMTTIFIPAISPADITTIYEESEYVMGDNDTKNDVRRLCLIEAKRKVLERVGTFVESNTNVLNYNLTKDWRMHFDYVASGKGITDAHRLIGERFASLRDCLPREAYARLYADVSILIASVGRQSAGWLNAMDAAAPPEDPGRGISRWQPHYDYVASGPGMVTANRFVSERLGVLGQKLSRDGYARLYADTSIILANYARMDW